MVDSTLQVGDRGAQEDSSSDVLIALDARRAAVALALPYTTFMDKVHRGEIAFVLVGGGRCRQHRRFLVEVLRSWALQNRVAAAARDGAQVAAREGRIVGRPCPCKS